MSAKEEFLEWYRHQREHCGLIDIDFFPGDLSGCTEEQFYAAANAINKAIAERRYMVIEDL